MKDRIRQLMESQNMTQQSFAQALNMSPASLSSIFNDRTRPTLNHVEAIKNRFPNINVNWLLFGKGEMFVDANATSTPSSPSSNNQAEMTLDFSEGQSGPQQSYPASSYQQGVPSTPNYSSQKEIKNINKPQRRVSSIQVIYDDSTIEIFVPKK